jgi:hypothetical protein
VHIFLWTHLRLCNAKCESRCWSQARTPDTRNVNTYRTILHAHDSLQIRMRIKNKATCEHSTRRRHEPSVTPVTDVGDVSCNIVQYSEPHLLYPYTIDVKLAVFWCPQVAWRFQTHDSLSSSKTGVNPGIRSWKSTHLNELNVRKPLVVSISQRSEELRLYNLV